MNDQHFQGKLVSKLVRNNNNKLVSLLKLARQRVVRPLEPTAQACAGAVGLGALRIQDREGEDARGEAMRGDERLREATRRRVDRAVRRRCDDFHMSTDTMRQQRLSRCDRQRLGRCDRRDYEDKRQGSRSCDTKQRREREKIDRLVNRTDSHKIRCDRPRLRRGRRELKIYCDLHRLHVCRVRAVCRTAV